MRPATSLSNDLELGPTFLQQRADWKTITHLPLPAVNPARAYGVGIARKVNATLARRLGDI
jgi:hypothetical protein